MTRWLAAARRASEARTELTEPTIPNPSAPSEEYDANGGGVLSVKSVLSGGGMTEPAPHGYSAGGRPLTWTGRVVSLDAWRALSEWEKHGPGGQRWCGVSRKWMGDEDEK